MTDRLESLEPGMAIPYGGDRVARVDAELAAAFEAGDRLVVVQDTGDLLHIPRRVWEGTARAVDSAAGAFQQMGSVDDEAISRFYRTFAERLENDSTFRPILDANQADVEAAAARGRSTTRLELTERMRSDMVAALRIWEKTEVVSAPVEVVEHDGWRVEILKAGLGVVGFVFEGRPNVFADATGVLRSGNTVVFRIGSDALGTARAIVEHALNPALEESGLPAGAVSLVDAPERSAGWALFSDSRLALAVARGSGPAVSQLGAVARQAGIPVSLHGTGGAWIVAAPDADLASLEAAVYHSLDRKVCNTVNNAVLVGDDIEPRLEAILGGLRRAAERRGAEPKVHVVGDIPLSDWWYEKAPIARAAGPVEEPRAEPLDASELGVEWEWEESPEISIVAVATLDEAVEAFNTYSPRFIASLLSSDPALHDEFYEKIDAPFVGNGFTRWVDGQYALERPELGLSNWQFGRLFGRGGVLSGDSIFTLRTRVIQDRPDIGR